MVMIFKKYIDFQNSQSVNENVQNAKIWLKKRALANKVEQMSKRRRKKTDEDEKIILTAEEVRDAENNPDFLKIKKLLERSPGWVFPFTKFFFSEQVPFEELETLYTKLKDYRSELNQLPMTVEQYADVVPDGSDQRKGLERLMDDIEKLSLNRITKKFVDKLPGDFVVENPQAKDKGTSVPSMKRAYQNASQAQKEKIAEIAKAFNDFGRGTDGTIDLKKNKELQDLFFEKITRYRNLNEVIQSALNYIKSANNAQISKFLQAIQKVNQKYGELNGAEVVYDNNKILIVEIKSFFANKDLNANTSHCIKDSIYQWDNYVGADNNFNKQYYIYNFDLPTSDNKSVIGITIEPKLRIRACHLKNDNGFSDGIKGYMKNLGIPFEILAPMSEEEIAIKKKRVIANKEIIKPNISLEQVKTYYNDGADPNAQQGKPLINSVSENNLEKTKWLLEHGSMPNIGDPIKGAQSLDMIQLLVSYGATITNEVYQKVADDAKAVKYLIDAGLDINFESGLPLRVAIRNKNLEVVKILCQNGADVTPRRFMSIKYSLETGNREILSYLVDQIESRKIQIDESKLNDWYTWLKSAFQIPDEEKKAMKDILDNLGLKYLGEKKIKEIIKSKWS